MKKMIAGWMGMLVIAVGASAAAEALPRVIRNYHCVEYFAQTSTHPRTWGDTQLHIRLGQGQNGKDITQIYVGKQATVGWPAGTLRFESIYQSPLQASPFYRWGHRETSATQLTYSKTGAITVVRLTREIVWNGAGADEFERSVYASIELDARSRAAKKIYLACKAF